MDKSIYDYVIDRGTKSGLSYREISDGSGVPKRTVEKILRREVEAPNVHHVQSLHDFFRTQEHPA